MKNKILQVIDPSHDVWVLGGIFRELRALNTQFYPIPKTLPPPNSLKNFYSWIKARKAISRSDLLIFSSLTVLVNFTRFFPIRKHKIGLWFTHKSGKFNRLEIRALTKCSVIYVHSQSAREQLNLVVKSPQIIVVIGAVEKSRFSSPSTPGPKIAWVGTPNPRKNPQLLLEIVESLPNFEFLLLGNGWANSPLYKKVQSLPNITYREITKALNSRDFDGTSTILITSSLEGGPMPLLEGMAAGLTPIYTDCGFLEDVMEYVGLDFQPLEANCRAFVDKIISQSPKNSPELNQEIRERVLALSFERLSKIIVNSLSESNDYF